MNYKTPGVYVEEISLLPPSVAQVETAIPAFIGYTEKAEGVDGKSLTGIPTRIKSLAEYRAHFGGPAPQSFTVTLADTAPFLPTSASIGREVDGSTVSSPYHLFYAMQLFFANGGGPCYIVSVGDYDVSSDPPSLDSLSDYQELKSGLDAARKVDEVTLLVVPEADQLSEVGFLDLCKDMLIQAGEMQDRFAVLDIRRNTTIEDFRSGIGTSYLNYGAAYYPYLKTSLNYHYADNNVVFDHTPTDAFSGFSLAAIKALVTSLELTAAFSTAKSALDTAVADGSPASVTRDEKEDYYLLALRHAKVMLQSARGLDALIDDDDTTTTVDTFETAVTDVEADDPSTKTEITDCLTALGNAAAAVETDVLAIQPQVQTDTGIPPANNTNITGNFTNAFETEVAKLVEAHVIELPPSSSMVGIYAAVDNARGVWKAPANVSVNRVSAPTVKITNDDQRDLNVHTTGKSINAIRAFSGKGILVWGARTLAGNDNEWRYISVRRFYNMVEESVKKASEQFVFEPNNANTWVQIRAMIENYLTNLWRQGALMGATTDEAFFVNVGLGTTMTQDDVLNGRMIVEIGLAVVRPAEFIILKFSHLVQPG